MIKIIQLILSLNHYYYQKIISDKVICYDTSERLRYVKIYHRNSAINQQSPVIYGTKQLEFHKYRKFYSLDYTLRQLLFIINNGISLYWNLLFDMRINDTIDHNPDINGEIKAIIEKSQILSKQQYFKHVKIQNLITYSIHLTFQANK